MQTLKYALESSASDPSCSLQQRICNFLLSYRSTPHATTGSSPAKLFLQRELRTRLSLVGPDLTSHVLGQQSKMKMRHDKCAKFREMAMGDTVLARDHLSSQKWQSRIVQQHSSPHSYQIQLEDGRIWRHHVDDVLQNTPALSQWGERLQQCLQELFHTLSLLFQPVPTHHDRMSGAQKIHHMPLLHRCCADRCTLQLHLND